jgi:hypothetical protein
VNPFREAGGSPRVRGWSVIAAPLVLLLLVAAGGEAGCGGSSSVDVGSYTGTWQRVEAGEPNPDFTLTITAVGDGASVAFANHTNGVSETVPATVGDGYLACTLPTGDDSAPQPASPGSPSPGGVAQPPAQVDLQLSLGENGQLVADLVLADGTLEPIWIYERAATSSSPQP